MYGQKVQDTTPPKKKKSGDFTPKTDICAVKPIYLNTLFCVNALIKNKWEPVISGGTCYIFIM